MPTPDPDRSVELPTQPSVTPPTVPRSDHGPEPGADTPPRRIADRYRLERVLGRGAMGTVWAAYDEVLRRQVAVKELMLPPGLPEEEADELRERTLREARAIASLTHPNVVTLYDVVRHDGEPFVVMELVLSRDLASLVREHGPLTTTQAAVVADAVAAALQAAHRAGITHRDVKPGNVLIGEGHIKLSDFGIARNVAEVTITRTGLMLGSPAFIAPEVASGAPVTPAADLWGLGATLFAALEGRPPYDAGDPLATVNEVVHGAVPQPSNAGPLEPVIAGLMVKDPQRRVPLAEIRRWLAPLLPPPGTEVFDPHTLNVPDPDVATQPRVARPQLATARRSTSSTRSGTPRNRTTPAPVEPTPLASDPGPLPFALSSTAASSDRRSSTGHRVAVAFLAVVLFVLAATTGFAVVRAMAGQPLLPAEASPTSTGSTTESPLTPLAQRTGQIRTSKESGSAGEFRIPVPEDWTEFYEERNGKLGYSALVRYVSPDGKRQLIVERFPGYFNQYKVTTYIRNLDSLAAGPNDQVIPVREQTVSNLPTQSPESARDLLYRTSERARVDGERNSSPISRTTYARLLPHGSDLWVVRVTVPVESEQAGRTELFDPIVPQFTVT
ncbi:MAG TPA: protein kinase [Pseudonocardiaceae bacterium]